MRIRALYQTCVSIEPDLMSDGKPNAQECLLYLKNIIAKFKERRCGFANRQQYLKQKIRTLERSIPALIAFNMMDTKDNCNDLPLCKVKWIMSQLSSHDDPTGKLLDKLQVMVTSLNSGMVYLHDKIITADIKLEESEMELESLQMENKELCDRLKKLEQQLNRHVTPSLHSIRSDDLVCLSNICQLGEAEIQLKDNIKDLKKRHNLYNEQLHHILVSEDFRNSSHCGITKSICQIEFNKKSHCTFHTPKCRLSYGANTILPQENEVV